MDPLEERVRRLLRDEGWQVPADPDAVGHVRAGVRRRRQRRAAVAGGLAAAVVVAAAGGAATVITGGGSDTVAVRSDPGVPGPGSTTPTPSDGPATDRQANKPTEPSPSRDGSAPTPDASSGPGNTDQGSEKGNGRSSHEESDEQKSPGTSPNSAIGQGAPVPSGFAATSVTAIDTSTFWVLGSAPGSGTATVAATRDGGDSFSAIGTLDAKLATGTNQESTASVHDIRFADSQHGWAYGGGLWSTEDGGRSWQRIDAVSGSVRSLAVGDGRVFALARDGGQWGLWRSASGTDAWQRLDVDLLDPDDLAVGDGAVAVSDHSQDATYLQVSTDGGNTFEQRPTDCSPDLSAGELSASADALWLTCPTGMSASRVAVSSDQGAHWESVNPGGPGIPANSSALGALSGDTGLVAAPGQVRLVNPDATDGPMRVQVPGLGSPTYAGFTTSEVGYLLDTDGHLFRTSDGGSTWNQVTFGG